MSAPALLKSQRKIITKLFPWLARIGTNLATGALGIRSAAGRTEIEGGGPAVARVGDLVMRLCTSAGTVYVCFDEGGLVWTALPNIPAPPGPGYSGLRVGISAGSGKVTCG